MPRPEGLAALLGPDGEVAEWSIAPHSKCGIRATVSGVRIPPSPPPPKGPFRTHGLRFIPEVWVTLGWRPASRGLAGISVFAGNFRPAGVEIEGSKHQPPGAHRVRELIEELCRRSMVAISRKCCD